MCYNYETLVRSTIKRAIHEHGYEEAMASLSETERRIWQNKAERLAAMLSASNESNVTEIVDSQSTYPGAEVQVIPITSKKREIYYFGFLPSWASGFNDQRKNFNARTDSLKIKPTWKNAWKNNQRCLVCAKGFYEADKQSKARYFFSVKDKPEIFFAGIFNHWTDRQTGEILKTFAIITTEPNALVEQVHNRMPVILTAEGEKQWIDDATTPDMAFELLKPFPKELMEVKEAPKPLRKKKSGDGELKLGI